MDNTTEQMNMQEELSPESTELSPEEAKAALGLSTRLSEEFMMSQAQMMAPEGSETPENGSESGEESKEKEKTPEIDIEALKTEISEEVKKEVMEDIKKALDEQED